MGKEWSSAAQIRKYPIWQIANGRWPRFYSRWWTWGILVDQMTILYCRPNLLKCLVVGALRKETHSTCRWTWSSTTWQGLLNSSIKHKVPILLDHLRFLLLFPPFSFLIAVCELESIGQDCWPCSLKTSMWSTTLLRQRIHETFISQKHYPVSDTLIMWMHC